MKHGWTYMLLGEVCDIINGKNQRHVECPNGKYPIMGSGGVIGYARDFLCEAGTTIVGRKGTINRPIYVNQRFWNVDTAFGIQPKKDIDSKFVYYLCKSIDFKRYDKGVTIPSLIKSDLLNIPIPVPPLPIQQQIVSELDKLNLIIEKKKQQVKELDKLAQSIFYEMFGDPTLNNEKWEVVELRQLFDIGSSKRVFESQWTDEGVPFYRAREVVRLSKNEQIDSPIFISEPLFKEYSEKYGVPTEGDIIVTAVGTLGVCYLVKEQDRFYFKDGNIIWLKNKGLCNTKFIRDQFKTDFIQRQIQGNANAAVVGTYTITNANKTKAVLPPMNLQDEYVRKVEAIEQQKDLINQSIREAQTLFDSRMEYYFGE